MQPESNKNDQEPVQDHDDYVPFDGFVNVNDIVRKRRQLRNAEFNVSDQSWDSALNIQFREGDKRNPDPAAGASL